MDQLDKTAKVRKSIKKRFQTLLGSTIPFLQRNVYFSARERACKGCHERLPFEFCQVRILTVRGDDHIDVAERSCMECAQILTKASSLAMHWLSKLFAAILALKLGMVSAKSDKMTVACGCAAAIQIPTAPVPDPSSRTTLCEKLTSLRMLDGRQEI